MPQPTTPPSAARRAIRKLGADIRTARRRRKLTASLLAQRAFTTRKSLQRVERGSHKVSVAIYASVLHALGMIDRLAELADPSKDEVGLAIAAADLPKRVRLPRK